MNQIPIEQVINPLKLLNLVQHLLFFRVHKQQYNEFLYIFFSISYNLAIDQTIHTHFCLLAFFNIN